jgi:hypothetical protein
MKRKLTALTVAALTLTVSVLAPISARADLGVIWFFVYCKREQVQKFEPLTGDTFTREAWVCHYPD